MKRWAIKTEVPNWAVITLIVLFAFDGVMLGNIYGNHHGSHQYQEGRSTGYVQGMMAQKAYLYSCKELTREQFYDYAQCAFDAQWNTTLMEQCCEEFA